MPATPLAVRGDEVLGAWETMNHIRVATLSGKSSDEKVLSMPGEAKSRKHPAVAMNDRGEYAVAWAEGTGWNKGGVIVGRYSTPRATRPRIARAGSTVCQRGTSRRRRRRQRYVQDHSLTGSMAGPIQRPSLNGGGHCLTVRMSRRYFSRSLS